jgi:hypothetical protein
MKEYVGVEVELTAFGGLLNVLVSSLQAKHSPVPIVQKAGWAPEKV